MNNIQQTFHKNYKLWNDKDKQQVQQFFLSNNFFNQFYQNKKFQQIARICLYRKLRPGETLILQNNNRPQAIILLTGNIIVSKKQKKIRKRIKLFSNQQNLQKSHIKQKYQSKFVQQEYQYNYLTTLKQYNQTLTLNSQCSIQSQQQTQSQILFIPCLLFYKLQQQIQNQRVQKIQHVLQKYFFALKRKQIHQLSQSNCIFRQFKMNNYIYRASSKPQQIFILLEGMVKLQKPGFSQQTLKQNILINAGMIFGQKDIKMEQRTRNAVACSAHVQVLTIPKNSFLKFASKAFPDIVYEQQKVSRNKLPKIDNNLRLSHSMKASPNKNTYLPFIRKSLHFHQNYNNHQRKKSQSQQKRQYQLIKNSHMLLDIKQKKYKKFQLRNFSPKSKQEIKQLLKNQKSKLKQLKIASRFSLNNSLLNL